MPLSKKHFHTSDDFWTLPDGERAELIDGRLYAMAPPNFIHQKLISEFTQLIGAFIKKHGGRCEIIPAPFAVNLDAEDTNWVEPDISVICDLSKLTDKGCIGAPDFIIEIVSPSSRKHDYSRKNALYSDAGVREYWIVDPEKERVTVYHYEEDAAPILYPFDIPVTSGIYPELHITVKELIE